MQKTDYYEQYSENSFSTSPNGGRWCKKQKFEVLKAPNNANFYELFQVNLIEIPNAVALLYAKKYSIIWL